MTRAYLRLDPAFFERKVMEQDYSGPELAALVGVLCFAEQQTPRGRFRNERLLKALLGDFGRHVPALIRRGDLTRDEFGRLYVDGWEEWQEGDVTVKERMARIRSRKPRDGGDRNKGDAASSNSAVPPLSGGGAKAMSGALQPRAEEVTANDPWEEPESEALNWLQRHKCLIREGDGFHQRLIHAVERHGIAPVLAEFEVLAKAGTKDGDLKGFLFIAIDRLDKATRPKLGDLEAEERAAESRKSWDARVEATRRRGRELHPELYEEAAS